MDIVDIRNTLPRANWRIGSEPRKSSITLHYNGPAVPVERQSGDGLMRQLHIDCEWQMRPGWSGTSSGADGLQYHYVVGADGTVYQTRSEAAVLWHAGHRVANPHSIAVHLPLGGNQQPTAEQWQAVETLCNTLLTRHEIEGRSLVKPHSAWSKTICPGPHIRRQLIDYREGPQTIWYRPPEPHLVMRQTMVQQAPDGSKGVAMILPEGTVVQIGALVRGEYRAWIANGTGFVRLSDLIAVEQSPPVIDPQTVTLDSHIIHPPRAEMQIVIEAVCSRPTGEYTRYDIERFIIPAYWQVCQSAGVDPLIALAQMCHETGNLTSWWAARPRRNPAGIGVTGGSGEGVSFPTWARDAIPAHVGRLVAYAVLPEDQTEEQIALVQVALAARWLPSRYYGCAPVVRGLSSTWATDGGYGNKVVQWAKHLQEGS